MSVDQTNFLYIYDKAITDWIKEYDFATKVFGAGTTELISVRFMALQKAFAHGKAIQMQTQVTTELPEVVVSRIGYEPDLSRNITGKVRSWSQDTSGADTLNMQMETPKPYIINYQIDVHADKMHHLNQMTQPLLYDMSPQKVLDIVFPDPFGTKYGAITLRSVTEDPSPLEVQANEVTDLTKTFDITITGWLYVDKYITGVKSVEEADLEFYDLETDVLWEEETITEV